MRPFLLAGPVLALLASPTFAHGLLIPVDAKVPPLSMVRHHVQVAIEDQVAVTTVDQTFHNHTDRPLEATYVFPVPRGASVNRFTMSVDGRDVTGEMVEADKARQVYTDIVRRTQDPGLLEYLGNNLMRMRVFPVPARGNQRVSVRFTSIVPRDGGLVEYVYPLKTDGKATRTLEEFSVRMTIKAQLPILSTYSPTHAVTVNRAGDHSVSVTFERNQAQLDKDFQLFYSVGEQDVGLTALTHRPLSGEEGYFLFAISPRVEASQSQVLPRDVVLVLDTSGSMAGVKMEQARKALKYCLDNLNPHDRFAVMNFSTSVGQYRDRLVETGREQVDNAKAWVDRLRAAGGTAIDDALAAALALRADDPERTFMVVFFTDGLPTVGETNPDKILRRVLDRNTTNTRIFTFGVGDDVNTSLLDQLADRTRAVSTYVRPAEDIEVKVSALHAKISRPVLTNLRLTTDGPALSEIYPPQLPDLFDGGQVVVLGRFTGQGPAAVRLRGSLGKEQREYVYELNWPARTGGDREFVEELWARRKVGYLLEQIRTNGEKKELLDEVVALAKRYGIATPYTSYLIVPDAPVPVARPAGSPRGAAPASPLPASLGAGGAVHNVTDLARQAQSAPGHLAGGRDALEQRRLADRDAGITGDKAGLEQARDRMYSFQRAKEALGLRQQAEVQTGKVGVDLAVEANNLRNQERLSPSAVRRATGRNFLEFGGVWIDEGFDATMAAVAVRAQSPAYFRILERHPAAKDVYRLGNYVLWVTPGRTALVIDVRDGRDEMSDAEIDRLFAAAK